ncbi:hypothetical protein AaE_006683 [Aphanomyces astaci]|uniref:WRKY19-like zinc finger domain-containing protein n=1 Tax=Aphanomyces astaci TaxID=112090 RepID=A0A6A4ZZK5_APHAT|nr:hypothetical protein AaE_006683 [Aphanomyces astaci]
MCDDAAIDAVSDLSAQAHALLEEASKLTSAVSVTLTKLRSASSHPQQPSQDQEATAGRPRLDEEAAKSSDNDAQVMRTMEARVQRAEEKASKLESAYRSLSDKYLQAKHDRDASVHRFWNWLACHVSVVGPDQASLLTQAWGYECGRDASSSLDPNDANECKRLLDEFKASSGVYILPIPPVVSAPASLPSGQSNRTVDDGEPPDNLDGPTPQLLGNASPHPEPGKCDAPADPSAARKKSNGMVHMSKRNSPPTVHDEVKTQAAVVPERRLGSMDLLLEAATARQPITRDKVATHGLATSSQSQANNATKAVNTTTSAASVGTTTSPPTPFASPQVSMLPATPAMATGGDASIARSVTTTDRNSSARPGCFGASCVVRAVPAATSSLVVHMTQTKAAPSSASGLSPTNSLLSHHKVQKPFTSSHDFSTGDDDGEKSAVDGSIPLIPSHVLSAMHSSLRDPTTGRKLCNFPGCVKFSRCRGVCTQHGGRQYCDTPQCGRVVQYGGKCTTHGGVKPCDVPGCLKSVQSRGKCKTHGGGDRCKAPDCTKGSISNGFCRGHGGGLRCSVVGCTKWSQRQGMCVRHHHNHVADITSDMSDMS